jgi:hypothetical protein
MKSPFVTRLSYERMADLAECYATLIDSLNEDISDLKKELIDCNVAADLREREKDEKIKQLQVDIEALRASVRAALACGGES